MLLRPNVTKPNVIRRKCTRQNVIESLKCPALPVKLKKTNFEQKSDFLAFFKNDRFSKTKFF